MSSGESQNLGGRTAVAARGKLILSGGSFVVACLVAAVALEITTPPTFLQRSFPNVPWLVLDPYSSWRNRDGFPSSADVTVPYVGDVSIDTRGYRVPSAIGPKLSGSVRVVCLGDSGTFGIWWDLPDGGVGSPVLHAGVAYPQRLAELAAAGGGRQVEVINAGVLGYSSSHGLRQLLSEVVDLEPDVVTVRFGYNDHAASWNPALRAIEPRSSLLRSLLYGMHRSVLLRVAMTIDHAIPLLHPAPNSVPWVSLEQLRINFERLEQETRVRGIHLLVLDYPLRPSDWGAYPTDRIIAAMAGARDMARLRADHERYQTVIRETARAWGIATLSTQALFAGREPQLFTEADAVHPNQLGSDVLARRLFDELIALGWL